MRLFKLWLPVVFLWIASASLAAPGDPLPAGSPAAPQVRYEFAIYLPAKPLKPALQVLTARLASLPRAPRHVDFLPQPLNEAVVMVRLDENVQQDYQPPRPESLKHFGRGLTAEQAAALQGARTALILRFAHPQKLAMGAYRASLLLVEQVAQDIGGLPWDEETREVFAIDAWHKRVASWSSEIPDATQQTVIHSYASEHGVRAISLGMGKFGLPDVVVEDLSWSSNTSIVNLINLLTQTLVEGARIEAGGRYDAKLAAIRHAERRKILSENPLPKATGVARLKLVQGKPDKGDPDNALIEIRFDEYPGVDTHARQDALLSSLFGSKDAITYVQHTQRLLAASEAARARLPELRQAFARGLRPGEYLLVKAPFATPKGGEEWMWVEVTAWKGDAITGLLKNDPFDISTLHSGQIVQVSQAKVFDYIRRMPDGQEEGNTTAAILREQEKAAR